MGRVRYNYEECEFRVLYNLSLKYLRQHFHPNTIYNFPRKNIIRIIPL